MTSLPANLSGFGDPAPPPIAARRHTVRFFWISAGIAIASFLQARKPVGPDPGSRLPLYIGLIAIELLLVWFVTMGVRGRGGSFRDLLGQRWHGWRDVLRDILLAIGALAAVMLVSPLLLHLLGPWRPHTAFLLPTSLAERVVWIAVAIAAGICEEVVYRGYLQRQLWSGTGNLPAAIVLQAVIFGAGHIYQGWKPAVVTAVYGLGFGLLAAWRRTVVPGIITHSLMDIIGGLGLR